MTASTTTGQRTQYSSGCTSCQWGVTQQVRETLTAAGADAERRWRAWCQGTPEEPAERGRAADDERKQASGGGGGAGRRSRGPRTPRTAINRSYSSHLQQRLVRFSDAIVVEGLISSAASTWDDERKQVLRDIRTPAAHTSGCGQAAHRKARAWHRIITSLLYG